MLVDMRKAHLWPPNMPVTRLAHFANAADVDTTIVAGRVLMRGRRPLLVDEEEVLADAARELDLALRRTGLGSLTEEPADYWQRARMDERRYPVRI